MIPEPRRNQAIAIAYARRVRSWPVGKVDPCDATVLDLRAHQNVRRGLVRMLVWAANHVVISEAP